MSIKRRLTISTVILIGYAVMLAAVAGLGLFANDSLQQLRGITRDLYEHPFTVSAAAADLKTRLYQLRNQAIRVAFVRDPGDDLEALIREADAMDRSARASLAVIKAQFLGDMDRVRHLETVLDDWRATRAEIFAAARAGDYARAERLARGIGTTRFVQAVPDAEYILAFARERGRRFVEEAEIHSARIVADARLLIGLLASATLATAAVVFLRVRFLQRELDRQATVDFLTGVANRRHFMAQAEREFRRGERHATPLALAVVDLDHFKRINDRYGHQVGDQVLKRFCAVCAETLRTTDLLGRIGGEEFAILLPNTGPDAAREVAERVRAAVAEAAVDTDRDGRLHFSASFGLAVRATDDDLTALFRHADAALYQAKAGGRNQVCVHAG